MPVEHRATLPAEPARVVDVLTGERFLRDSAAGLGSRVQDLEVRREDGAVRTRRTLRAPTAGIPEVFRRFVSSSVTVVDARRWTPAGDGGYAADIEVRAEIFGWPVVVRGRQTLGPSPGGTLGTTTAEVVVNAPLVGRRAEAAVRELVQVVLRREDALLVERLRAD